MNLRLLETPTWNGRARALAVMFACLVTLPTTPASATQMTAVSESPQTSDCRHLEMQLVPVLDVGSQADTEPQSILGREDGAVFTAPPIGVIDHAYLVGKFEVTVAQYVIYLNSVAVDDPNGLYSGHWATDGLRVDSTDTIARSGDTGSYTYSALRGADDEAMRDISWRDAVRFVNWLENGCPVGAQGETTTESGAYEAQLDYYLINRDQTARVWLPERDEWLKAGYFSLARDGWGTPGWHRFSTQSDVAPLPAPDYWNAPDSANYEGILGTCPPDPDCQADVNAYGASESYYGTRNQGGNVWEWVENRIGVCGEMRGGAHNSSATSLSRLIGLATCIAELGIDNRLPDAGLRIAVAADASHTRFVFVQGGITLR